MISLRGSINSCKVDTAWANRYQSDRFENPDLMVCPSWSGRDLVGRPASQDSFYTKSAGCNTPSDRVYIENALRPQYMESTTVDSYGFRANLFQPPATLIPFDENSSNLHDPIFNKCKLYPYDWEQPTYSHISEYSRRAQNLQHQMKAYNMLEQSGFG